MDDADRSQPSNEQLLQAVADLQQRMEKLERFIQPDPPETPVAPPPLPVSLEEPEPSSQERLDQFIEAQSEAHQPVEIELEQPISPSPSELAPKLANMPLGQVATKLKKASDGITFEQFIGTKGLLLAGIVVLGLVGIFGYIWAKDHGFLTPTRQTIFGALFGLIALLLGEWTLRKKMQFFAAGVFGLGIVLLYQSAFVASPKYYQLIETPTAFALMCLVTVIGIGISIRSRMQTSAIISLVGAMATPILLSIGENQQVLLMSYMLVVSAGFCGLALWKRWQSLTPLALTGTVLLFAGWFISHYAGEAMVPTLAFGWGLLALFGACAVIGIAGKRLNEYLAAIIALTAAVAMALLVYRTTEHSGNMHSFAIQLLLVLAGVIALSTWRRYAPVPLLAALGTLMLGASWIAPHLEAMPVTIICGYQWSLLAMVMAAGLFAFRHKWTQWQAASIVVAGGCVVGMWIGLRADLPLPAYMGQIIALNATVLALAIIRRWNWMRIAVWLWSAAALVVFIEGCPGNWAASELVLAGWIWTVFALLMADIGLRASHKAIESNQRLDSALSAAAVGLMFAATYYLLHETYAGWMGSYAAVLGIAALSAAWPIRYLADKRKLAYCFLGQGLILITLAVPIQFDKSSVTIAWTIQAAITMFLASRLGNKTLIAKSFIVFALALIHYVVIELNGKDEAMARVLLTVGGVEIRYALALAVGMAASLLAAAAILTRGEPILGDEQDMALSGLLIIASVALYAIMTCIELPSGAATWWWFVASGGAAIVAIWHRSQWLWYAAAAMLTALAVKFMAYDTLLLRSELGPDTSVTAWVNWQLGAAVALMAVIVVAVRLARSRCNPIGSLLAGMMLLAAVLGIWAGSFEIDRWFAVESFRSSWANPKMATQMAYSLFWAIYAAALLIIGFVSQKLSLRYFALAIFGITLIKFAAHDTDDVDDFYRILGGAGLGVLSIVGSFLYHRYFRSDSDRTSEQES